MNKTIVDLLAVLKKTPFKLVGVGVTAFNRVMPAFFLPDYQIVCYKNSQEIAEIERKCRVMAIERDCQRGIKWLNSASILDHPQVQKFIQGLGEKTGIFVYKSTPTIEKICQENGWRLLANKAEIRDPSENKKIFRETLLKIGAQAIEGEVLKIRDFNEQVLEEMQKKYGQSLVLKLPEVKQGGGKGNTFVTRAADLPRFWEKVKQLGEIYQLEHLLVERRIAGVSPSITGCVTRFGVLTGVVQTQITDIPEVVDIQKGGGIFVGHDWSFRHYSESVQRQAEVLAQSLGKELWQKGYRGIFGIDLLVEEGTDKVYPCECNPRFTGAFPVYSLIQWQQGEPPFDLFHLLEFLEADYQINLPQVQTVYRQPKEGAHLVLSNKSESWVEVGGNLAAGVYQFVAGELQFIRPGLSLAEVKSPEELILTDGVPQPGSLIKPNLRILKIIFPGQILTNDGKSVNQRCKLIVEAVYRQLRLKEVGTPPEAIAEEAEF